MPATTIDSIIAHVAFAPSAALVPARRGASAGSRERRVTFLLGAIALLGLADLLLTMHAVRTTGMFEANPVVLWLIRLTESANAIAAYKSATVVIGSHLLYRLRRHRAAEAGAWLAAAAFAGVIAVWVAYLCVMAGLPGGELGVVTGADPGWIAFR